MDGCARGAVVRNRAVITDVAVLVSVFLAGLYITYAFDLFPTTRDANTHQRTIDLDEALLLAVIMALGLVAFAARRYRESIRAGEALQFKTALLEAETETTLDAILAVDEKDHIVLVNKQFMLCFGMPEELVSRRDDALVRAYVTNSVEDPEGFRKRVEQLYRNRTEKSRDELRLKDGTILDRYSAPLVDSQNRYRGRIWYFRDITDRRSAEAKIEFLAHHDALTGLPNRVHLQDRLDNALANARRRNEKVALLFLDLDHFKIINDTFGHSIGDLVLKEVAERLRGCSREQDTLARVGGEEFVTLLNNIKDVADAVVAAERIAGALKPSFDIQGQSLTIGCSMGISMFPDHGADGAVLMKNADAAMYSAKASGRGNVRFFTDDMNAQMAERLTMDRNLRRALDREEFFLVYQPQIEIETQRIVGFEALIRWQHPEMGLVAPDRFIPVAESNGLILPIGEWVLRTACAQAKKWRDDGLPTITMAVNVSAVQFRQDNFRTLIGRVLDETGLSPRYLELELTESLLLSNANGVFAALQGLKDMGVQLAIDDFGTGYSSLVYLKQFPVGKLKIDRAFIRDLVADSDDAAITVAIISMAKSLNLKVIAEGVETETQMSFLRKHGCDESQGCYFSKPVSADEAAIVLQGNRIAPVSPVGWPILPTYPPLVAIR